MTIALILMWVALIFGYWCEPNKVTRAEIVVSLVLLAVITVWYYTDISVVINAKKIGSTP